jgi:hypothetical protein
MLIWDLADVHAWILQGWEMKKTADANVKCWVQKYGNPCPTWETTEDCSGVADPDYAPLLSGGGAAAGACSLTTPVATAWFRGLAIFAVDALVGNLL